MHFVEVGCCFRLFCMAGIRNAVPVLGCLKGICKRLLVPAVLILEMFWGFATDLLEMAHFLMASQGTPYKGVSWFCIRS